MPAVLTHNFFAEDVLAQMGKSTSTHSIAPVSEDAKAAFLLGNQGPDPLFFLSLSPTMHNWSFLGRLMHSEQPSQLLASMSAAIQMLEPEQREIGKAWAQGFLCHYLLDSSVHPLVFCQQFAICGAGIEGIDRNAGTDVHALIEGELDEVMLFTRTGQTVATWQPHEHIARCSDIVLEIASEIVEYLFQEVYGHQVPENLYTSAVRKMRFAQRVFDSPTGKKRALLIQLESLVRPHSKLVGMCLRPVEVTSCAYANDEHALWANPWTKETTTASFDDLFSAAAKRAMEVLPAFGTDAFDLAAARALTSGLNFSGQPAEADAETAGQGS